MDRVLIRDMRRLTKRESDVRRRMRSKIWRSLKLNEILDRFERDGVVRGYTEKYARLLIGLYLNHMGKFRNGVELASYAGAIYLVNANHLLVGIFTGVIGIVIANRMSEIEVEYRAMKLANSEIEEWKRKQEREARRLRGRY